MIPSFIFSCRPVRLNAVASLVAVIVLTASGGTLRAAEEAKTPASFSGLSVWDKFLDKNIPAMGPHEIPIEKPNWKPEPGMAALKLPGKGAAQHPMLYIGEGYNKMLLVKDGRIVWGYETGKGWEYDDIWLLSNGNILFTRMSYAEEITPDKQVVWHRDAPEGTEIHTIQPLGLDRIMLVQNGLPPHLLIIDGKTGKVETDQVLPAPSATDQKTVHGQFRRARVTAQGTYLVSFLTMNKVVEYDRSFKEIWSYDIRSPWAAIRLHNGNTLITDEAEALTREVNPKGETVWEFKLSELPPEWNFQGSQSCVRLANGNTILCSRGDNGKGVQMVEISPDRKIVSAMYDWERFGPCTAIQVLDEAGVPETPGDLER